ncbi:hypothetical protein XELAEV_18041197mg [Xenopus laevis]|uniref:Uncharacterized protein n=1 Tax=Xenopus laevis TaxID=8355 RepID=A0A974C291_XENLA|nr:hypothetical protein XELAEV_18041197mg [Xenopus laevis]
MFHKNKKGKNRYRLSSSSSDVSQQSPNRASVCTSKEQSSTKLQFSKFLDEVTASVLNPASNKASSPGKYKGELKYTAKSLNDIHRTKNSTSWKEDALCNACLETDTDCMRIADSFHAISLSETKKVLNIDANYFQDILPSRHTLTLIVDQQDMPSEKNELTEYNYNSNFITEIPDVGGIIWLPFHCSIKAPIHGPIKAADRLSRQLMAHVWGHQTGFPDIWPKVGQISIGKVKNHARICACMRSCDPTARVGRIMIQLMGNRAQDGISPISPQCRQMNGSLRLWPL